MDNDLQDQLWNRIIRDLKADGLLDENGRITERALGLELRPSLTRKSPRDAG